MAEQLPIINALVIINYSGIAAKSRWQASILNLLVNNKTTQQIFLSSALFRSKTELIRDNTQRCVGGYYKQHIKISILINVPEYGL